MTFHKIEQKKPFLLYLYLSKNPYKTNYKNITGLKSGVKYFVKVRTYKTVNGVKYYSEVREYTKTD